MKIEVPQNLAEFAKKSPCPVYAVGGFVRNRLLGLPLSDIDICGAFPVEEVVEISGCGTNKTDRTSGISDTSSISESGVTDVSDKTAKTDELDAHFITVNKGLGTAQIHYKGEVYEYTRFRSEVYGAGGAHSPLSVDFGAGLLGDAMRRDFCCNSIYYDLKNEQLVDPLGGLDDLKNRVLRSHDPARIFAADGLRLMRLCRLAAELGFEIEDETARAAAQNAEKLKDIAAERKREELEKILLADKKYGRTDAHFYGLTLLHKLKLLPYILPSLAEMEIDQNPKYHRFNALMHTLLAVKYAPPAVRLAALMHDVGKPVCLLRDGNMYDHPRLSAEIVRRELGQSGLKYPVRIVEETARLASLHMYDSARNTSDGKMRIFTAENLDIIDKLQALCLADKRATGMLSFDSMTESLVDNRTDTTSGITSNINLFPRFLYFKKLLINENAPLSLSELKIDGTDLQHAGLSGRLIGDTLKELWRECILNPKLNNREWLIDRVAKIARV